MKKKIIKTTSKVTETKKVELESPVTSSEKSEVIHSEEKKLVGKLEIDLGRGDLNLVVEKLNEIIENLNER